MSAHHAACSCEQLHLVAEGDPIRISMRMPDAVAVPIGAFADPAFPPPRISVWESRRHPWVAVPEDAEHRD